LIHRTIGAALKVELFAINPDGARRLDPEADLVAAYSRHGDADVAVDEDRLVRLAAQDQHRSDLLG
jgi:hypothetical protein